MKNFSFIRKYVVIWFVVFLIAIGVGAKNLTDIIRLVSITVGWMAISNISISLLNKKKAPEWLAPLCAIGGVVFSLLLVTASAQESASNLSGALFLLFWFGGIVGGFAFMEKRLLDASEEEDKEDRRSKMPIWFVRVAYAFFLFTACLYAKGNWDTIEHKLYTLNYETPFLVIPLPSPCHPRCHPRENGDPEEGNVDPRLRGDKPGSPLPRFRPASAVTRVLADTSDGQARE